MEQNKTIWTDSFHARMKMAISWKNCLNKHHKNSTDKNLNAYIFYAVRIYNYNFLFAQIYNRLQLLLSNTVSDKNNLKKDDQLV